MLSKGDQLSNQNRADVPFSSRSLMSGKTTSLSLSNLFASQKEAFGLVDERELFFF
ncbi:hypothetical protein Bca4012_092724 [Brassica carinata]